MHRNKVVRGTAIAGVLTIAIAVAALPSAPIAAAGPKGKDVVTVELIDYGFVVNGALKAGGTLRIKNSGKEAHHLVAVKVAEGTKLATFKTGVEKALASNDEKAFAALGTPVEQFPTVNFLAPGRTVETSSPSLGAGTYGLVCFFSAESDAMPHLKHGMISLLTVVADKAKDPKPDAEYTAVKGKAIAGPNTLKAGHRVLAISVGDGLSAFDPAFGPLPAGSTLEKNFTTAYGLVSAEKPKKGTGAEAAKLMTVVGAKFGPDKRVYLGVDVKPGTYVLGLTPDDLNTPADIPASIPEQITITVT